MPIINLYKWFRRFLRGVGVQSENRNLSLYFNRDFKELLKPAKEGWKGTKENIATER